MAATAIPIDTLPSINPATGEVLAHIDRTPASMLPEIISHARVAQGEWAKITVRDRCAKLRGLREQIMASRNDLAEAVVRESGKPRVEALFADIFVALDYAEYWSKNAPSALRTRRVTPHSN
jgi:betaine-aldehyde dehydrogenase